AIAAAAAGLAFAVPAGLLAGRARRWSAGAGVAALAGLFLLVTRAQLGPWRDRIALLAHACVVAPGSALVEYDLGSDLARAGRLAEGERHLRTALALQETSLARTQLGNVLLAEGRGPEALAQYQRALELAPRNAEALLRLAKACEAQGRFGDARLAYERFLEVAPPSLEPLRRQVAALLGR
ncbi:MAG TPA: tetratricopeptide repeat protein, partial [Anaeromyxobacteraceae bacterium]|nr:tetratricopeptide repeat protein [Anaeromyxobacteraceae bacterium]